MMTQKSIFAYCSVTPLVCATEKASAVLYILGRPERRTGHMSVDIEIVARSLAAHAHLSAVRPAQPESLSTLGQQGNVQFFL